MDRWVGKIALVTGASSGTGSAIAVTLANQGLKVVGVARRLERIEELKKEVTGKGELHALKCDVSIEKDIHDTFDWIKKKFGAIHVLVNNAGIFRPADQDPNQFREVLNVNVIGLSICTQNALKLMKEAGVDDGQIIHINSILGHYVPNTGAFVSHYPASKFAVTGLTETLRQELTALKSKIRITSISPGFVHTEIIESALKATGQFTPEAQKQMAETPPLGIESQDIADAVVYVLSTPARVQIHELTIRPVGEPY